MTVETALMLVGVLSLARCLTLFQLPGTWLMVVASALGAAIVPESSPVALSWSVVVLIAIIARVAH